MNDPIKQAMKFNVKFNANKTATGVNNMVPGQTNYLGVIERLNLIFLTRVSQSSHISISLSQLGEF